MVRIFPLCLLFPLGLLGQQPSEQSNLKIGADYVLGPNDQIVIRAMEAEEISNQTFRVDGDGSVNLPLLGKVRAGGLTVERFEAELVTALRKLVKNPQVVVDVVQARSEPVFLRGAFKSPGVHQLQGPKRLTELLSLAGGLAPNARRRLLLTRKEEWGQIPLPDAKYDPAEKVSTVEVALNAQMQTLSSADDILLQPYDVIEAPRAPMVYVSGEVAKPGGFELEERDSIPVTQLISMAGGPTLEANLEKVKILRSVMNTSKRAEIPLNFKEIQQGRANDYPVLPNDVLVISRSPARAGLAAKVAVIAVPSVITTVIWVLLQRN